MKKYVIITAMSCNVFSCAMEQTPLEKANAEQMRYQKADACAEIMRDQIDQNILGIDTNRYLRSVAGRYYSRNRNASLTTQQDIVNEIDTIASYMPSNDQPDLVLSCLYRKHSLFRGLIDRLVDHEVNCLNSVRGSSIDTILSKERKICAPDPINKYVKECALRQYNCNKQGNGYRTYSLPCMNFVGEKDIHFAPLFGLSGGIDIERDQLLMSSDSKYLRAIDDIQQKATIWNMQTGEQIDVNEVENISNSYSWTRLDEGNHHCKRQRVLDKNGKYLVTPGMALAFGSSSIRAIEYKMQRDYSFPVIMLFVKPTAESQLCQDAFLQSKDDEEELKALQLSQAVNKLEGLPARNLKSLIAEALKNVHNQARL